jgi:hypothetical protein
MDCLIFVSALQRKNIKVLEIRTNTHTESRAILSKVVPPTSMDETAVPLFEERWNAS